MEELQKISHEFDLRVEFSIIVDGQGDPSERRLWQEFLSLEDFSVFLGEIEITHALAGRVDSRLVSKASEVGSEKFSYDGQEFEETFREELDISVRKNEKGHFFFFYGDVNVTESISEEDKTAIIEQLEI